MGTRRTTKVKVTNNLRPMMKQFYEGVAQQFGEVADEGRDKIVSYLGSGEKGLDNDTMAASASVYTVKKGAYFGGRKGSSDYGYPDAKSQFLDFYTRRYNLAHAQERLLDEFVVTSAKGTIRTAVASCSLYMGFWEEGHRNRLTKKEEHRPHFDPMIYEIKPRILKRFVGLMRNMK